METCIQFTCCLTQVKSWVRDQHRKPSNFNEKIGFNIVDFHWLPRFPNILDKWIQNDATANIHLSIIFLKWFFQTLRYLMAIPYHYEGDAPCQKHVKLQVTLHWCQTLHPPRCILGVSQAWMHRVFCVIAGQSVRLRKMCDLTKSVSSNYIYV